MRLVRCLLLCSLTGAAAAQQPSPAVAQLSAAEPWQRERAFCDLWWEARQPGGTSAETLAALHKALLDEVAQVAAATLLRRWNGDAGELRTLTLDFAQWRDHDRPVRQVLLGVLKSADVQDLLANTREKPEMRIAALFLLADRRELTDAALVAAAADDDVDLASAATTVLVHERHELTPALLAGLRQHRHTLANVLPELAVHERPSAAPWLTALAADELLPMDLRLLAAVAARAPADEGLLRKAMAAMREDAFPGALREYCARVPGAMATQLLGEVQNTLQQGVEVSALRPLLERLPPEGNRQLLAMALTLTPGLRDDLCGELANRGDLGYRERVRAALDGEIPLEPHWLLHTYDLLSVPARRERLLALLGDETATDLARERAFALLLEAGVADRAMVRFARRDTRRLIELLSKQPPEGVVLEALTGSQEEFEAAVHQLRGRNLTPAVEAHLKTTLSERDPSAKPTSLQLAVIEVLLGGGSEPATRAAWAAVRELHETAPGLADWFGRRREPWVHQLLLEEVTAPHNAGPKHELLRDRLRLLLAERGDRHQLDEMIDVAAQRDVVFVRRARHVVPNLTAAQGRRLLAQVAKAKGSVREEVVLWLGGCNDDQVQQALLGYWQDASNPELQEIAVRGLLSGPMRARMLEECDRRLREGPFDDPADWLAGEVVATTPADATDEDLRRIARIVLIAPLHDVERELKHGLQFGDGRGGFPAVAAVGEKFREIKSDAGPAFAAVVKEALAHPNVRYLSRARLLVLWQRLAVSPQHLDSIAAQTAHLVLELPDSRGRGEGEANLFAARWLDAQPDGAVLSSFASARAARALLREPDRRLWLRQVLGEPDPDEGFDPRAALAAASHLTAARSTLGAPELAKAHARIALELGAGDRATAQAARSILEKQ